MSGGDRLLQRHLRRSEDSPQAADARSPGAGVGRGQVVPRDKVPVPRAAGKEAGW